MCPGGYRDTDRISATAWAVPGGLGLRLSLVPHAVAATVGSVMGCDMPDSMWNQGWRHVWLAHTVHIMNQWRDKVGCILAQTYGGDLRGWFHVHDQYLWDKDDIIVSDFLPRQYGRLGCSRMVLGSGAEQVRQARSASTTTFICSNLPQSLCCHAVCGSFLPLAPGEVYSNREKWFSSKVPSSVLSKIWNFVLITNRKLVVHTYCSMVILGFKNNS